MHPVQVLAEDIAIEEELFTEIAPGMRKDLRAALVRRVPMLYMLSQLLHVVDALLANENRAALQADQTERLLMCGLHMPPQTLLVRELLFMVAVGYKACQRSELHAFNLGSSVRVVDGLISAVLVALVPHIVVKLGPRELLVRSYDNLLQLLFAERAIFVLHQQPDPQTALGAHVPVPAGPKRKELYLVVAKDARFLISVGDVRLADSAVDSLSRLNHIC